MDRTLLFLSITFVSIISFAQTQEQADFLLRGGTVYDGSGALSKTADMAIRGDRIVAIGDLPDWKAAHVIDT